MDKKVFSFILGMLSIVCVIPIFESISEVICGKLEVYKGKATKDVLIINKDIQDLQEELEPVSTQCIGFQVDNNEEEYYEDEEDC